MFKTLISNSRRQLFLNLLVFYALFLWFRNFGTAVLPTHFLDQGLSIKEIIFGYILMFLGSAVLQLVIKNYSLKSSWRLALITILISLLLTVKIIFVWQYYLASIFRGFSVIFFHLVYNVAHFQLTPKIRTGFSSAIMYNIPIIISLVAPLAAGLVAESNYLLVWALSGLFFLFPLFFIKNQIKITVNYQLLSAIKSIQATRVFYVLQGIWEALVLGIIPIFSLYFIKTPLYFGAYMAYLSLVGLVANFLLGRYTDKLQKRVLFLYPITLLMALFTFIFPFALNNIIWWIIITGVVQFLLPLFWNVSTAMVIDAHSNLKQAIPARELILSLSRAFGFFLVFLNFYFQSRPTTIFYILGFVILLYPLVLFYNTKISRKYQYL